MHRNLTGLAGFGAAGAVAAGFAAPASAQCVVILDNSGSLAIDQDYDLLSSAEPGGQPAGALVTTGPLFGPYQLEVTPGAGFAEAPPGGYGNVTISGSYSTVGATIITEVITDVVSLLGLGLTEVTIHLAAARTTGVFPSGDYSVDVAVRCSAA